MTSLLFHEASTREDVVCTYCISSNFLLTSQWAFCIPHVQMKITTKIVTSSSQAANIIFSSYFFQHTPHINCFSDKWCIVLNHNFTEDKSNIAVLMIAFLPGFL